MVTEKDQKGPTIRGTRLQKELSRAGVASRRKAEALISDGRVSVNGKIVRELGVRVLHKDVIRVDGDRIDRHHHAKYLLLNKPPGVVCTLSDPQGRRLVTELVPKRFGRLYPVGRLDFNSEGVLILTNDGEIANRLSHPRFKVEKIYAVKVRGLVENDDPRLEQAAQGVALADGTIATVRRMKVFRSTANNTWLEWTLTEGKNREIRRVCDALGFEVVRLQRRAVGPIALGNLRPGDFRELTKAEVKSLKELGPE